MSTAHHLLPDADEFSRMESELFTRLEHSHTRRVRRHRLGALAAVVLVSTGGVAAGTVASNAAQSNFAYCYSAPSISASHLQLSGAEFTGASSNATNALSRNHRISQAIKNCTIAWESGFFAKSNVGSVKQHVPLLQPCIRNDQTIAVFPKSSAGESSAAFCGALGLDTP